MREKILIVEDDANLRDTLADNLELEGFKIDVAANLAEARKFLQVNRIDLIVLDIMLPDGNGYELSRWIRKHIDTLILMLTARNLEKDVIEGFISGADDYVSKPYRSAELLLRIKALLRRKNVASEFNQSTINSFTVNWNLREVKKQNQPLHLTKTAFDILYFLYRNINRPCSRDDILDAVWGKDVYVDNRTVDNFVSNLKKQLNLVEGEQYHIKTIRGIGYSLIG